MRSRLEARYAAWLDRIGAHWQYEPCCYADQGGEYLPDFLLDYVQVDGVWSRVFVEVKPEPVLSDLRQLRRIMNEMLIIRATEPEAVLLVDTDPNAKRYVYAGDYYGWVWWPLATWINRGGSWAMDSALEDSMAAMWVLGQRGDLALSSIL